MGRKWVADVAERDAVKEVYLVVRKTMPVSRNGKAYLSLMLSDRTGQLDARIWDNVEATAARFGESDFVAVEGNAVRFQERIQLHISSLKRADEDALNAADFLPKIGLPPDDLWNETLHILHTVTNPHLQVLIQRLTDDAEFVADYQRMPAGKSIHHARLGGLMEHNLSICKLLQGICTVYDEAFPGLIDRDLLLTAGFLHDVGKIVELSVDKKFEYTDAGRLVGHVVLGYEFVTLQTAAIEGFPEDLALHLKHLLLSHHGQLEHGAAKRPKTAEAWILHFVDIMDCRVAQTADLVSALPPAGWTPYQKLYDRYLWRGHARDQPSPADPDDEEISDE